MARSQPQKEVMESNPQTSQERAELKNLARNRQE